MNHTPPDPRETALHRLLNNLPDRQAPASLEARVLASLAGMDLPWWKQSWSTWPLPARALAVTLLVAVLVVPPALNGLFPAVSSPVSPSSSFASWHVILMETLATVVKTLVQGLPFVTTVPSWAFLAFSGIAIGLYLACVAFGSLLFRVFRSMQYVPERLQPFTSP